MWSSPRVSEKRINLKRNTNNIHFFILTSSVCQASTWSNGLHSLQTLRHVKGSTVASVVASKRLQLRKRCRVESCCSKIWGYSNIGISNIALSDCLQSIFDAASKWWNFGNTASNLHWHHSSSLGEHPLILQPWIFHRFSPFPMSPSSAYLF